jgi:hypothetical protein
MATVEFRYDPKNTAWFTANAAMVLKAGEPAYHDTTGLFKLGDGVTALSALSFLPTVSASTPTIQQVLTAGQVATTTIETTGFIKTGGTSAQFLKADGSVDSNVYGVGDALTTNPLSQFAATTSSQLAGVISDETGSGSLVFGTSPTFTTGITTPLINGTSGTLQIGTTDLVNIGNKTTTSQRLVRIGQDTAWIDLGSYTSPTSSAALYMNVSTPDTTNFTILGNASYSQFAHKSLVYIGINNAVNPARWDATTAQYTQSAATSGAVTAFTFTSPASTNQTLGTNIPNFRVLGANKQWATGTVPLQYFNYFTDNTISFVGASTATNSYNTYIESVVAGTNATLTRKYSLGTSDNVAFGIANSIATLYLGVAPSASNYMLSNAAGAGSTYLNAPTGGFVVVSIGGANRFQVNNSSITFNPSIATATNATTCYGFSFSSNSNQTLSTEIPGVLYNNYSRNWATGNITIQREQYIKTATYTAIGASVITNAYGFYVEAPTASTNISITNNYAAGFNGAVNVIGSLYSTGFRLVDGTQALNKVLISDANGNASWATSSTGYAKSINNIAINTTAGATGNTDYYYFCTSTLTLTLPTAIGNTNTYNIKLTSGSLTINTTSSQTIDGSLTITTSVANTAYTLISDGTNWQII